MSICRSLRAQQRDRVRRLGLLRSGDENAPELKTYVYPPKAS